VSSPSLPKKQPSTTPAAVSEYEGPSQEVRDERAREAKAKFNDLDGVARGLEKQAATARAEASDQKKIAKEKKGQACETRLGGKVLCIRPLNSGY